MSGVVHLERHLNRVAIEAMAKKHGFARNESVEKFLIDFEVLYHMQRAMPDCVVRGGMAMPFHLDRDDAVRLSIDVDAVTELDAEGSSRAMADAFEHMGKTITHVKPHKPRSPQKLLPLHTYYCRYNSALATERPEVKIDLFYGGRSAQTTLFRPPTALLGVEIDFGVTAYSYSQMIADKLSTLAFGTMGLDATDPGVPKHIYDIASLIMYGKDKIEVSEIASAFEVTCGEETAYMQGHPATDEDVCDTLRTFYRALLVDGTGLELDKPYAGRFATFATNMLARSKSKNHLHVTDVMLAGILAGMITDVRMSRLEAKEATATINQIRETLRRIGDMSVADNNKTAKELRRAYPKDSPDRNLVKTMKADQVYLYGLLLSPRRS